MLHKDKVKKAWGCWYDFFKNNIKEDGSIYSDYVFSMHYYFNVDLSYFNFLVLNFDGNLIPKKLI